MNYNLELFSKEFAANLYDSKRWFSVIKDWSTYVQGNLVHIPQGAAKSTPIEIDGTTVLPVASVAKTFQDITFPIVNIAAEPRHIMLDQDQANTFEGRTKLTEDMLGEIGQGINIRIGHSLQPAAAAVTMTGTRTRANYYGHAAVKSLAFVDVLAARTKLAKDNANMDMLYMLVDPVVYSDLLLLPEFNRDTVLSDKVLVDGFVGKIAGINVILRNVGLAYTALGAKPTINYADSYDNTHFSSVLVFDASKVGYANSATQVGIKEFETGYYTDLIQARTRVGASPMYANGEGLVAIIEA